MTQAEPPSPPPHRRSASLQVPHGFFGREGGVSTGAMASLQCGFGADDERRAIERNRRLAADAVLAGAQLASVRQVHGTAVVQARGAPADVERPEADAIVSNTPGLLLGILTADCAPVLLADREARVVGAAHAGWKGALGGVCESVIAGMERLGARRERIAAAVGPCIARTSYEVDDAFRARFAAADQDYGRFFTDGRDGHAQFDLEGFVAARLAEAGAGRVDLLGRDTYSDAAAYYSYRRATHREEPSYGRQISLIGLADTEPSHEAVAGTDGAD